MRKVSVPLLSVLGIINFILPVFSAAVAEPYFGEYIEDITQSELTQVEAGYRLFVKTWTPNDGSSSPRNGISCVSCHNTPMPGGSGLRGQGVIQKCLDRSSPTGFTNYLAYSECPASSSTVPVSIRAPALFGIGQKERFLSEESRTNHSGFGYFGRIRNLEDFVALAFATELGMMSARAAKLLGLEDNKTPLPDTSIQSVTLFLRKLAPPPFSRSNQFSNQAMKLFVKLGCAKCHSMNGMIPTSANVRFMAPLSDYLPHLVRQNTSDGIVTPALWTLQSLGPPFLHDASAQSVRDAILAHTKEAGESASKFIQLSNSQQNFFIQALEGY